MNIELSVVIVNYNGLKFLENCFESLNQNLADISYEIIVLDNNSIDNSCALIKQNYPSISLIESNVNHGFGAGNNAAVKQAKGEYLLLLNNDTIILDNLLPVLNHLKSDKTIGVIGINMLDANKNYLQAGFNLPNFKNMLKLKNLLKTNPDFEKGNFKENQYEVGWLCGSFLMMPKVVYKEIKGFDPDYFMYVEDVDFCKKIETCGYKRVFLSKYSYIHFVGFNNLKNPMLIKGYQIYINKHFFGIEKLFLLLAININKIIKQSKNYLKIN